MSDAQITRADYPDIIDTYDINNKEFMEGVQRIFRLHQFLLQSAIPTPEAVNVHRFRGYKYSSEGRAPIEGEWHHLESTTQSLFNLMDEYQRQKYIAQQIPDWLAPLSIAMALLAALTFAIAVTLVPPLKSTLVVNSTSILITYMIWLVLLGVLGATASIGFNAIALLNNITFHINNKRLLLLRLALGGLFALFISLPVSLDHFIDFIREIQFSHQPSLPSLASPLDDTTAEESGILFRAIMLLLPFLLGYSTDLTIVILNRFLDAIKAFFGVASSNVHTDKPEEKDKPSPRQIEAKP